MKKDAAIEEIRSVRRNISARFGHNTRALLEYYQGLEAKYKDRLISARAAQKYAPEAGEKKQPHS